MCRDGMLAGPHASTGSRTEQQSQTGSRTRLLPWRPASRRSLLRSDRRALALEDGVLGDHDRLADPRHVEPARGGELLPSQRLPLWKVNGSKQWLMLAHDEAQAYVQDLVGMGDLLEVEPERYVWSGRTALQHQRTESREQHARVSYGHLEFRSRR